MKILYIHIFNSDYVLIMFVFKYNFINLTIININSMKFEENINQKQKNLSFVPILCLYHFLYSKF